MELSYISTKAINEGNRLSLMKLQQQLATAQKEVSSGRLADVGQSLGVANQRNRVTAAGAVADQHDQGHECAGVLAHER